MLENRFNKIRDVLSGFKGTKNNEPQLEIDKYILQSMWVMMLSEFEGSIKNLVENYIDNIKNMDIQNIHICLLLQNFYADKKDGISIDNIMTLYKKKPEKITYNNFTRNKKTKYKFDSIEKLFNTLGIFFIDDEVVKLKTLDAVASTRDSIAHGDTGISITRKELEGHLLELEELFKMLQRKLNL